MIIGFADAVRSHGDRWARAPEIASILCPEQNMAHYEKTSICRSMHPTGKSRDPYIMWMATQNGPSARHWQIA